MKVSAKMIPVETTLTIRGGRDEGKWWRSEFTYNFGCIVRTCVNAIMYPHPTIKEKK
jgi:hypothetical protein